MTDRHTPATGTVSPPAVDCHAHVFDPRYGFADSITYTPLANQRGTSEQFLAVLEAHGFTHGLLVSAGAYAPDNGAMLDAIARSGNHFRGVAIIHDMDISERELDSLADGGVTGVRFNIRTLGLSEMGAGSARFLDRLRARGWSVHLNLEKHNLAEVGAVFGNSGVQLVFDHFARPDVTLPIDQPGFRELLAFGRAGRSLVKLSGPFRSSRQGLPYRDVEPFIEAVIEAFTLENCVWGSDWPFVLLDERIDYGPTLACLARWLPDESDRRKVLWETPARAFGFRHI
jgi:predicted TIM-barrel fold metal-dependent hydrolase